MMALSGLPESHAGHKLESPSINIVFLNFLDPQEFCIPGNFLYSSSLIWSMIALPITAFFLLKKIPAKITLVPAASAFMGLPFVYLTVTVLSIGAYVRNPLSIAIDIAIAAYAVWLIMHDNSECTCSLETQPVH